MARSNPFSSPMVNNTNKLNDLCADSSPDVGPRKNGSALKAGRSPYDWCSTDRMQNMLPIGPVSARTSTPDGTPSSYRERSQRFRRLDSEKNAFIDDLLAQVEAQQQQLDQLRQEHERGSTHIAHEKEQQALLEELEIMRSLMDRNSYISVLIDGDALVFNKTLLTKGEVGGKLAAQSLVSMVNRWAVQNVPHLPAYKIRVKLYARLRDLATTLVTSKVITHETTLEHFWAGFHSDNLTVDLIDTRYTKSSATERIKDNYRCEFLNVHCNQVFLAALPSQEYIQLLEEMPDIPLQERLTIFEPGELLSSEKFDQSIRTLDASSLFMKVQSTVQAAVKPAGVPSVKLATPRLTRVESNGSSMTYKTAATSNPSNTSTPQLSWAAMTAQPFVPSRSSTPAETAQPAPTTIDISSKRPSITKYAVLRNRNGERVDDMDKDIPYAELQRVKKNKLCNAYYLQGKDACNGNCGHTHSHTVTNADRRILREVARMTPCYYRLECQDESCIYGHRCPQSKPGKDNCWYGPDCRFTGWGHGIDEKVVNTVNIKG